VKGSLFKLRGFAGAESICPSCGGETMRASPPLFLRPVLPLLGLRYRWCRACLRQWIARR
jgi:formate dehydrogenase maturation protein FdhE